MLIYYDHTTIAAIGISMALTMAFNRRYLEPQARHLAAAPRARMWQWRRAWVVAALLLLGACSGTSFMYNRLDFLVPWYVDDYAELDQTQKAYLDELLVPFLAWHRARELPAYVKVLESIEDSLNQPLTPAVVATLFGEFEQAWLRLEDAALDWLLALGARLSEAQIAGFLDEMRENQRDFEEEYLSRTDAEFHQDSYDNLLDNVRDYLGTVSDKQRALLRESSERLLRSDKVWLQERAQWIEQLSVLLQRQPGWQERVRAAVAVRNENMSPEYQRIYQHNLNLIHDLLAQLLNERSPEQDSHLRHKLSDLRNELQGLIAQGNASAGSASG